MWDKGKEEEMRMDNGHDGYRTLDKLLLSLGAT